MTTPKAKRGKNPHANVQYSLIPSPCAKCKQDAYQRYWDGKRWICAVCQASNETTAKASTRAEHGKREQLNAAANRKLQGKVVRDGEA